MRKMQITEHFTDDDDKRAVTEISKPKTKSDKN
jgi:hypothetical protein